MPPCATPRTAPPPAVTSAAAARSWPTLSSNGSPGKSPPTPSPSTSDCSSPTAPCSDETANPDADEPGELLGYGPVPADLARGIALGAKGDAAHERADVDETRRSIRRLFANPVTGRLMTMDAKAREFTRNERRFIRYRDHDTCRTPWCGAPIRHTDHIHALEHGGPTHVNNGQGLCQACNHAKQAPGWHARRGRDGTITTATPTGHTYPSRQPDLPGTAPPPDPELDRRLAALHSRGRLAA